MLAVLWHLYFGVLAVLFISSPPSKQRIGILLAIPLLSVSLLAWISSNPFNGTIFALFAVALVTVSMLTSAIPAHKSSLTLRILGGSLFLFGWIYPHFLRAPSILSYLHSSPTGLIPCPSLSMIIGLALIFNGLSFSYSLILGLAGVFYGIFGAFRLRVRIDLVLLIGSLILLSISILRTHKDSNK